MENTRVGQYIWDVDIMHMDQDEVTAMADACAYRLEQLAKQRALMRKMQKLLKEAEEAGAYFTYRSGNVWVNLTAGRDEIYISENED